MEEKKQFSKVKIIIIVCLILVALMPFVVKRAKNANDTADFDEAVEYINSDLKDVVEEEYEKKNGIRDISVDLKSEIYKKKNYSFISWDLNAYVEVYVEDSFDDLTPEETLEKLQELYSGFREVLDNTVSEEVPLYMNCSGNHDYKYMDKNNYAGTVYTSTKINFHVKTSFNDYMYGDAWKDGYNLNGGDVYVKYNYYPTYDVENNSKPSIGGNNFGNTNNSYDDGYDDIYFGEDYDVDRYNNDVDYANGVDDAMDDAEYDFDDEW